MQIHVAEFRYDEVKNIRLAHLFNLSLELEIFEDGANIRRESFYVANKVFFDIVRVAFELFKRQRRMIVESLPGSPIQHFVRASSLIFPSFCFSYAARTFCFVGANTQSKRRNTVMGSMTRSYCGGR